MVFILEAERINPSLSDRRMNKVSVQHSPELVIKASYSTVLELIKDIGSRSALQYLANAHAGVKVLLLYFRSKIGVLCSGKEITENLMYRLVNLRSFNP